MDDFDMRGLKWSFKPLWYLCEHLKVVYVEKEAFTMGMNIPGKVRLPFASKTILSKCMSAPYSFLKKKWQHVLHQFWGYMNQPKVALHNLQFFFS